MLRPMYESAENVAAELAVLEEVSRAWGVKPHRLKLHYELDAALVDPLSGIVAYWAEIKCRTNEADRYPTYMISAHKWLRGKTLAAQLGGQFRLVVGFTDKTLYVSGSMTEANGLYTKIGGRQDRGDMQDVEPCVFIPMNLFQPL